LQIGASLEAIAIATWNDLSDQNSSLSFLLSAERIGAERKEEEWPRRDLIKKTNFPLRTSLRSI
jgi:hypothetical protein